MNSDELKDITEFLESLKVSHYVNYEDCWYSCPLAKNSEGASECCNHEDVEKGECTCHAGFVNARIDEKIKQLNKGKPTLVDLSGEDIAKLEACGFLYDKGRNLFIRK